MHKIRPFLWFDGKPEEGAKFYTSIFKRWKIRSTSKMSASFTVDGLEFIALNGRAQFKFTPAISFFVGMQNPVGDRYGVEEAVHGRDGTDGLGCVSV